MVYPRLVFFLFQQDTPFLLLFSYTTNKHSSTRHRELAAKGVALGAIEG